jgi:hypothetical protein
MFQSLRQNSPIYIFHKIDNPYLEIGTISSISLPKPKYAIPATFNNTQEMCVDIVVKINNNVVNYNNLPATLDIADSNSNGDNIVIASSKEAMNAEILSLKQKSIDELNRKEYNENVVRNCDKILADLNPEFAEKQAQKAEIDSLKLQMQEMSKNMQSLIELNKQLMKHNSNNKE